MKSAFITSQGELLLKPERFRTCQFLPLSALRSSLEEPEEQNQTAQRSLNAVESRERHRELGRSLDQVGLLDPLIVLVEKDEKGHWIVAAGNKRLNWFIQAADHHQRDWKIPVLLFRFTSRHQLILDMAAKIATPGISPFLEAELIRLIHQMEKRSLRDLARFLGKSKSRVDAALNIARLRPALRAEIERRFPRPGRELLEELQRADQAGDTGRVLALLNSDGKKDTVRALKREGRDHPPETGQANTGDSPSEYGGRPVLERVSDGWKLTWRGEPDGRDEFDRKLRQWLENQFPQD